MIGEVVTSPDERHGRAACGPPLDRGPDRCDGPVRRPH